MTLVEIYNLIEALSLAQPNVHSFVMEFSDLNREDTQYSAVICQQRQHVHNGDFMTYNFYLGYADKMSDLENDEVEIHSTGINILNTIVTLLNENEGIYATSSEYIDAKEKFEAECAVVYCSLAVEVPSACYTMDNPFKPYLKDYYTKEETDDAITEAIDNQPFKTINGMDITGIGNINIKGSVTEEQEERIAEIPTLISDVNELKDNKADKSWVDEQGFAKESDIPDVSGFITMSDVEAKHYLTEIPSDVARKSDIPDVSGFITMSDVESKNYVDKQFLDEQGYVTEQALDQKGYLTEIPSDVARKSDIPDVSGFITMSDVEAKHYLTEIPSDVARKSDIPTVPTKVSAFENDANYLTTHQSLKTINGEVITGTGNIEIKGSIDPSTLDNYYTKDEIDAKHYLTEIPSDVARKSDIPDVSGFITMSDIESKNYVTEQALDQKGYLTEIPSDVARKSDIPTVPTKVSAFENDANYVDKQFLDGQGYLTEIPSDVARKSDIPDVSSFITMSDVEAKDYVTEQALDQKGYLTEIPSDVARKSDIPDTYSKTEIDSMIGDIDGLLNQILG